MRPAYDRRRPREPARTPDHVDVTGPDRGDPLLTETPVTVRDDEDEVFDLGFIVDDRDDRRDALLASWQRLDTLDSGEALETGETAPMPREALRLTAKGAPEFPTDAQIGTEDAERDEEEFATDNALMVDPYASPEEERQDLDAPSDEEDLDGDDAPDAVSIRGRSPGIALGFGTSLPQDIGAGGFRIRDNPLSVHAADRRHPISTEAFSDVATGNGDVDETGTEAEIARLADEGGAFAEEEPTGSRRPRPSDPAANDEPADPEELPLDGPAPPEAGVPAPLDAPKPEMGIPQPIRMPAPGETIPAPEERSPRKPAPQR
jgi:hypothetical protein